MEEVAKWMIEHGYATGHGDTIANMLDELEMEVMSRENVRAVAIVHLARYGKIDNDLRCIASIIAGGRSVKQIEGGEY